MKKAFQVITCQKRTPSDLANAHHSNPLLTSSGGVIQPPRFKGRGALFRYFQHANQVTICT